MIYRPPLRYACRRDLTLNLRDAYGLNSLHRVQLNILSKQLLLTKKYLTVARNQPRRIASIRKYRRRLILLIARQLRAGDEAPLQNPDQNHIRATIADFEGRNTNFSQEFRFNNGNQLRSLLECFHFPTGSIIIKGSKFSAEEILMISLKRLSFHNRWCEVKKSFPSRHQSELSKKKFGFWNI